MHRDNDRKLEGHVFGPTIRATSPSSYPHVKASLLLRAATSGIHLNAKSDDLNERRHFAVAGFVPVRTMNQNSFTNIFRTAAAMRSSPLAFDRWGSRKWL